MTDGRNEWMEDSDSMAVPSEQSRTEKVQESELVALKDAPKKTAAEKKNEFRMKNPKTLAYIPELDKKIYGKTEAANDDMYAINADDVKIEVEPSATAKVAEEEEETPPPKKGCCGRPKKPAPP